MRITGHRVRTLDRRLPGVAAGTSILPTLAEPDQHLARLEEVGFRLPLQVGDTVLPAVVGPRSRFNAEGGEQVHRDQDMEQAWQFVWARWIEWHGPYQQENWGVKSRPYWRYPRTPILPPSVSLRVASAPDGQLYVVTEPLRFGVDDPELLLHEVNLLLELFSECDLLSQDLAPLVGPPTRQLNWEVLPAGNRPWADIKRELASVTGFLSADQREVAEYRLRLMHSFGPDFQAYGRGGFRGYVVFGFEDRGVYVLESLYTGNATYVFGTDWQRLSGLTKAEIINGSLAEHRIIHQRDWESRLKRAILG